MTVTIGRRKLLAAFGGAAAVWPLAAHAQHAAIPIVGYLSGGSSDSLTAYSGIFRRSLAEAGYVEGQNVEIEYRWAGDQPDRLPALATELVSRQVSVIVTTGGPASSMAAKAATTTIPIVFLTAEDPVRLGLVASLARPGGNWPASIFSTASWRQSSLGSRVSWYPEWLVWRCWSIPPTRRLPRPNCEKRKPPLARWDCSSKSSTPAPAARLIRPSLVSRASAPMRCSSAAMVFSSADMCKLSILRRAMVPATYDARQFPEVGGLMSYGSNIADAWCQTGVYVGRILKGAKPADLPVVQSSKFEPVMNAETARMLDLTIPPTLLSVADEVIE